MTDNEAQRPEGKLLGDAIKRSPLSARKIAGSIGISDTRLRHIVNGYQPAGNGQRIIVVGPAATLARAAAVLEVTADQLDQAGRSDAAEILRAGPDLEREPVTPSNIDRIIDRLDDLEARLDDLEQRLPVPGPNLSAVAKTGAVEPDDVEFQ